MEGRLENSSALSEAHLEAHRRTEEEVPCFCFFLRRWGVTYGLKKRVIRLLTCISAVVTQAFLVWEFKELRSLIY